MTLNFQQVQGYSARDAGLAIIPTAVCIFLFSRQVGKLSDKYSPRPILIIGTILMIVGFLLLTRPGVGDSYWTAWFPGILVYGLGLSGMVVPLTSIALGALPQRQSGIASGVNGAASRIGQMLSVAVFGGMRVAVFRNSLLERVEEVGLDTAVQQNFAAQARNLGELQPPPNLAIETQEAIQQMIHLAFVDGFRMVMLMSALMVFISLLVLLATVPVEVK